MERKTIKPPCPYYNNCGGCQLQEWPETEYQQYKQQKITSICKNLESNNTKIHMHYIKQRARRRVTFQVELSSKKKTVALGFYKQKSHKVKDIEHCLVLEPILSECIIPLKELVSSLKRVECIKAVQLTKLSNGLEVIIHAKAGCTDVDYAKCKSWAIKRQETIARLNWATPHDSEKIMDSDPCIRFSDIKIAFPPGSFLQASTQGEKAILETIQEAITDGEAIIDLYAGLGTYTVPLAVQGHTVHAFEGNEAATKALQVAVAENNLPIVVQTRDLYKKPITTKQLEYYDSAIINPPRNGAESQIKALASSTIKTVIMVSCNPDTFERDAKHMLSNQYKLISISGIDQFYYTHHLEVVGIFRKNIEL